MSCLVKNSLYIDVYILSLYYNSSLNLYEMENIIKNDNEKIKKPDLFYYRPYPINLISKFTYQMTTSL